MFCDRAGYINNYGGYGSHGRGNSGASRSRTNSNKLLRKELHYVETYEKNNNSCHDGYYNNYDAGNYGNGYGNCGYAGGCAGGCAGAPCVDAGIPCVGAPVPVGAPCLDTPCLDTPYLDGGCVGGACRIDGPYNGPYNQSYNGPGDKCLCKKNKNNCSCEKNKKIRHKVDKYGPYNGPYNSSCGVGLCGGGVPCGVPCDNPIIPPTPPVFVGACPIGIPQDPYYNGEFPNGPHNKCTKDKQCQCKNCRRSLKKLYGY